MEQNNVLLKVQSVEKRFGGVIAVNQCSMNVQRGEIHALIGPNGAGKTTLFNLISGLKTVTGGNIYFKDIDITNKKPNEIASLGVGRTFQINHLVDKLTVVENVMLGRYVKTATGMFGAGFLSSKARREERESRETACKWLEFMDFPHPPESTIDVLAYGERRMLEIAQALTMDPSLILLDEPAAGLNTQETAELSKQIKKIQSLGITVLIVEHDMAMIMNISDTITVLNFGEKIAEGSAEAIKNDPKVIEAYLGGDNSIC